MKKYFKSVFLLLCTFCMMYFGAQYLGIGSFVNYYIPQLDEIVSEGSDIRCQVTDEAYEGLALAVERELCKLPSSVREALVKSGWHIYITGEDLATTYYNSSPGSIYGSTFYNKKIIVMQADYLAIQTATIHEVGHWLDRYSGNLSSSKEFAKVYDAERYTFMSYFKRSCVLDNKKEYFAEAFNLYIESPRKMQLIMPITYAFFTRVIGADSD